MLLLQAQTHRYLFDLAENDFAFRLILGVFLLLVILAMAFMITAVFLRVRNDRRNARDERLEKEWQPVLLEVLSERRDPNELLKLVGRRDVFLFTNFLYRVGRQVRGADLETIRTLAKPYLVAAERLTQGDAETRARKIQILGLLGFKSHASQIIAALDDRSPLVAMVAARTLVRREHPEYVGYVLAKLERFRDWSQELLSSLLAGLGPDAAPALREVLVDSSRPESVRAVCAIALGTLNDAGSAEAATRVLQERGVANEEESTLRAAVLTLLGRVGNEDHTASVRSLLAHDNEEVRAAAYTALGLVSRTGQMNDLVDALDDSSGHVAIAAARGLRRGGQINLLRELAASDHPRAELIQQVLAERVSALD